MQNLWDIKKAAKNSKIVVLTDNLISSTLIGIRLIFATLLIIFRKFCGLRLVFYIDGVFSGGMFWGRNFLRWNVPVVEILTWAQLIFSKGRKIIMDDKILYVQSSHFRVKVLLLIETFLNSFFVLLISTFYNFSWSKSLMTFRKLNWMFMSFLDILYIIILVTKTQL